MRLLQRVVLCALALLVSTSPAMGQGASVPNDALRVRIKLEKSEFYVGDPILAKITISNVGVQSFLIPNRASAYDEPSHADLYFEIKDDRGKAVWPTTGWSNDCGPEKPTKLLLENILRDYLLLLPGTSYVLQTDLGPITLKPGTYHVKSYYSASFSPRGCSTWAKEDVEHFPFSAWVGQTQLNDISFTILPQRK